MKHLFEEHYRYFVVHFRNPYYADLLHKKHLILLSMLKIDVVLINIFWKHFFCFNLLTANFWMEVYINHMFMCYPKQQLF